MTGLRFLRDAERELIETARYYEEATPGLGGAFLDEVERALQITRTHPAIGRAVMGDYRRVLTTRFPYAVIYRPVADELIIVAIAHTSRRPGYWKQREPDVAAEQ